MASRSHYTYPNGTLKNTLGIRDPRLLAATERRLSSQREQELRDRAPRFEPSLEFLQNLHYELFQDIYPWAGEIRDTEIAKSQLFCRPELVVSEADKLFDQMAEEMPKMKQMSGDALAKRFAYYMGELNAIHPFREGNGRTQRMFMESLAHELGKELTFPDKPKQMVKASQDAFMKKYDGLEAIFREGMGLPSREHTLA